MALDGWLLNKPIDSTVRSASPFPPHHNHANAYFPQHEWFEADSEDESPGGALGGGPSSDSESESDSESDSDTNSDISSEASTPRRAKAPKQRRRKRKAKDVPTISLPPPKPLAAGTLSPPKPGSCEHCETTKASVACHTCMLALCSTCWPLVHKGVLVRHRMYKHVVGQDLAHDSALATPRSPADQAPLADAQPTPIPASVRSRGRVRGRGRWSGGSKNRASPASRDPARRSRMRKYCGNAARKEYLRLARDITDATAQALQHLQTDGGPPSPRLQCMAKMQGKHMPPEPLIIRRKPTTAIDLSHFGIGNQRARVLAAGLMLMQDVDTVDLRDNRVTDSAAAEVVTAVVQNGAIVKLDLSENTVGIKTATALRDSFVAKKKSAVEELMLSKSRISTPALLRLTKGLAHAGCRLSHLDLSHNNLADAAGRLLGHALASNQHIQSLNLEWNMLRTEGAAAIAQGLAGVRNKPKPNHNRALLCCC